MSMINHNAHITIGIDHGYGNIKTAHSCFKTGVAAFDREPAIKNDLLVYGGRYYNIGEGHKPFVADKIQDSDYYILTLAAIAREMEFRQTHDARVTLAVGLPLTWMSRQKEQFAQYLWQNQQVDFSFRGKAYRVAIVGIEVFPQGFAAIASRLREFKGNNLLVDIGNGTMNMLYITNGKPQTTKCFTEKFGVHQCTLLARESLLRQFGTAVDDCVIEEVLQNGTADISERYVAAIRDIAMEYVDGIFSKLREREYDPEVVRLYVVGGGGCLVKHFGAYDPDRVTVNDDICATAKGYEQLAEVRMRAKDGDDR